LQLIKEISTSGGRPLIFIPLTIVITISAIKDIVEDYKRHKSDSEENNKKTLVYRHGKFEACKWRDVRVGDVLKVAFPSKSHIILGSRK
jgi:phospholipid-transporting ATPase